MTEYELASRDYREAVINLEHAEVRANPPADDLEHLRELVNLRKRILNAVAAMPPKVCYKVTNGAFDVFYTEFKVVGHTYVNGELVEMTIVNPRTNSSYHIQEDILDEFFFVKEEAEAHVAELKAKRNT